MTELLPTIVIETAANPDFAVIWMHGLGADGNDFVPIVPELGLPAGAAVRFVFPNAPVIPVTVNSGYRMRAWYDILSMGGINREVDEAGIRSSCEAIRQLIAHENARGIPSSRIVLAGFSQGGAMAYSAGLTHPEALAGIIALSAYIPSPGLIAAEASAANRQVPILAAHGTDDDVVPLALGQQAASTLTQQGYSVEWLTYQHMPHSVCMEEVIAIGEWLTQRLGALA